MYVIGKVCFGIPLTSNGDGVRSAELEELIEEEEEETGIFSYYHGGGIPVSPAFFGVELGEIDECNAFILPSDIPTATDEHRKQFDELWLKLDSVAKELICDFADGDITPFTFIMWTTS